MNTRGDNPINTGLSITPNGLARGEILGVEDETKWIKDLYKLQQNKNFTSELSLVIQLMEYTRGRQYSSVHEIKQDYLPFAYGVLKVNQSDGTIRYGTYELDLYKPPVNLARRNQT